MIIKMLKKDLQRNRLISLSLILFIVLPAMMMASAGSMIAEMSGSLDRLFEKARIPHFVQMHAGEMNQDEIAAWSRDNALVRSQQTVEMISVDGSSLYLGESGLSQADNVMDIGFQVQSSEFDYLLDLNNNPVLPLQGEIAVPIYFREKEGLKAGDTVSVLHSDFLKSFRISAFIRDAQMNPALVHSKRFIIHSADFDILKKQLDETEYLIEFILTDPGRLNEFSAMYEDSGLPSSGPAVTEDLFRILNVLSDGITVTLIILVSLLFCFIAVLCLRFTILAALEEDFTETGVMKAVGLPFGFIKRLYLTKYGLTAALAAGAGFLISFGLSAFLTGRIRLYMGRAPQTVLSFLIPFTGSFLIFMITGFTCLIMLRRLRHVSAVEALRCSRAEKGRFKTALSPVPFISFNCVLGLRDLLIRLRLFWLPGIIYFVCSFIMLVPLNLYNTVKKPSFITYMGLGYCDIRIDLRPSENIEERFKELVHFVDSDGETALFAPMTTSLCQVQNPDGTYGNLSVETGDFSVFPLEYLEGAAPCEDGQLALSFLSARDLGVHTGDLVELVSGPDRHNMRVSGIYQDITNGGRTAKAVSLPEGRQVLWHVININLKEGVSAEKKVHEYSQKFYPARVSRTESYVRQTLGSTVSQLKLTSAMALAASLTVSFIITLMFLRMVLIKDSPQIAVMRAIGFSVKDIKRQYRVKTYILLLIGVVSGTAAANTIGEKLVSLFWSLMGASDIRFVINPLTSYVVCPLVLVSLTALALAFGSVTITNSSISALNAE